MTSIPVDAGAAPAWDRLAHLREEVSAVLEQARREKTIGSSLEAAIELTFDAALEADRVATATTGSGLADLFIVSEVVDGAEPAEGEAAGGWTASSVYPALRLRFRKAKGSRCDRCWKVTPEADATGLCDRCRRVLEGLAPA